MRRVVLSTLLLAVFAAPLWGHEKGAIRLANKEVAAGGELVIRGEKLPKSNSVILTLVGALATHSLGEVATTATGTFDTKITLPAVVKTGAYVVLAEAGDGDELARADVVVTAAMAHDMATHMADSSAMAAHPSAAMMKLDATRSGLEWTVILIIVGFSIGGGVALLATSRHAAAPRSDPLL